MGRALVFVLLSIAAFSVRALPFPSVLRADGVFPNGSDAYYHLRRITYSVANFPDFLGRDSYLNFPAGGQAIWTPVLDWVLAAIVRLIVGEGDSAGMERMLIWVPPLLGAATVLTLYGLARGHFSARVALLAAILLALLPAHFSFSQIGFIDHHAAVALSTTAMLGAAMALFAQAGTGDGDVRRGRVRAGLLGGVTGLAILVWPGSLIHAAILQLALVLRVLTSDSPARAVRWARLTAWTHVSAGVVVAPFALGREWDLWGSLSPVVLSNFQPLWFGGGALVFAAVAELWRRGWVSSTQERRRIGFLAIVGIGAFLALTLIPELREGASDAWRWLGKREEFQARVAESLPLFASGRAARAPAPEALLSYAVYGLPLILVTLSWFSRNRPERILLLGWTAALFGLTLLQRRFMNSLSPAYCLVVVWAGAELWKAARSERLGRRLASAALMAALAVAALGPTWNAYAVHAGNVARWSHGEPPHLLALARLHAVLVPLARWLRENSPETSGFLAADESPEYGVLGAWADGHVLRYVARRPVVQDNFGDDVGPENFELAETYFSSEDEAEASEVLRELRVRYVVVRASGSGHSRGYGPKSLLTRLQRRSGSALVGGSVAGDEVLEGSGLARHRLVFESARIPGGAPKARGHYQLFEWVTGARVSGLVAPGAQVRVEVPLQTQRNRRFSYVAATRADASGRYSIRLPYATEPFSSAVRSLDPYRISSGTRSASLHVTERAVRRGERVGGPDLRP